MVTRRQSALMAMLEMRFYKHPMMVPNSYFVRIWLTFLMRSTTCFKHGFLIRHPVKVFLSWKKLLIQGVGELFIQQGSSLLSLPTWLFPAAFGFKELYELMEYVEKELHQELVILDIGDLLADSPGILSAYSHKNGIPYKPELPSRTEGSEDTNKWVISKSMMYNSKY